MSRYCANFLIVLFFFCAFSVNAAAQDVLTWQDCVSQSAKNHPDLISAQESVKETQAAKKITASGLLPQIDASLGASRAKTSTTSSAGVTTSKISDSYSYGASGTQLVFDGLKTANDVKAASENITAAQYDYKFTSSEVRLRLRTAFINLLKSQESLNLTKDIYDLRRNDLELITLRYESGMEHKGAMLTAVANLAQAKFEIEQNQRGLEVSQRQLLKEMGRAEFAPVSVKGEFTASDAAQEKPDFEILAKNNPSLGKLIAQSNAALFGIKSSQANYFPSVSASAGADRTSGNWPPRNNQWDTGLAVSLPIFEGGLRSAEVAQAKAVFAKAIADERSTKDSLILALEQTWAELQDAITLTDVKKKFLNASEERSKIAEAQYSLGLIQFDNWTIIEDDLVSAKKSFLDTQANMLQAEANWIQAKGETLEYAK